ncbi:MAG: hypothetical protein ACTS4X_01915 [Candidatus Hodgkinia cicadicola]
MKRLIGGAQWNWLKERLFTRRIAWVGLQSDGQRVKRWIMLRSQPRRLIDEGNRLGGGWIRFVVNARGSCWRRPSEVWFSLLRRAPIDLKDCSSLEASADGSVGGRPSLRRLGARSFCELSEPSYVFRSDCRWCGGLWWQRRLRKKVTIELLRP